MSVAFISKILMLTYKFITLLCTDISINAAIVAQLQTFSRKRNAYSGKYKVGESIAILFCKKKYESYALVSYLPCFIILTQKHLYK